MSSCPCPSFPLHPPRLRAPRGQDSLYLRRYTCKVDTGRFVERGLDFARKDLLRLSLGAAGALCAGVLSPVMVQLLTVMGLGSRCAGFGCSVFMGGGQGVFPFKLGGAAVLESANLQAQFLGKLPRPTRASVGPALGLFSPPNAIGLRRKGAAWVCCSLLCLSWEARSGAGNKPGLPLRRKAGPSSCLCRGHGDIAHRLQGSHNSFKTITLFI